MELRGGKKMDLVLSHGVDRALATKPPRARSTTVIKPQATQFNQRNHSISLIIVQT
jgi:hypothetical protein